MNWGRSQGTGITAQPEKWLLGTRQTGTAGGDSSVWGQVQGSAIHLHTYGCSLPVCATVSHGVRPLEKENTLTEGQAGGPLLMGVECEQK